MSQLNPQPEKEVTAIADLDADALRQRWAELYGMAPAPRISRDVLMRAVAFRIQEEAHGGLAKPHRRQLRRLAEMLRNGKSIPGSQVQSFKLGTKLIREWKGKVHEVVIADDTYIWAGNHYRSLSQIARAITGTRWSGPRFFGLEVGQDGAQAVASPAITVQAAKSTRNRATAADG